MVSAVNLQACPSPDQHLSFNRALRLSAPMALRKSASGCRDEPHHTSLTFSDRNAASRDLPAIKHAASMRFQLAGLSGLHYGTPLGPLPGLTTSPSDLTGTRQHSATGRHADQLV